MGNPRRERTHPAQLCLVFDSRLYNVHAVLSSGRVHHFGGGTTRTAALYTIRRACVHEYARCMFHINDIDTSHWHPAFIDTGELRYDLRTRSAVPGTDLVRRPPRVHAAHYDPSPR
eukprot:2820433-Rhodomonas_salina.1